MRLGLEVLAWQLVDSLKGARVGFCCNSTTVDRQYRHGIDLLRAANVDLVRLFAPEHGVRGTAQDMIGVDEQTDAVTGLPVVSLYGSDEASLHPRPQDLEDLDVVLFDIQDIGARYYTYQATLGFVMRVAGQVGTKVIVLDRPNPIDGVTLQGNVLQPGFESFVGAFPLATRHALTMGELARFFQKHCGIACELDVVLCEGWERHQWADQYDAPWVHPSPNMPTLEAATVYPGMCLVEGTNLSEGRGTTRPFNLCGAPWLNAERFAELCRRGAERNGLSGVAFRATAFQPGFQKHAGQVCKGIEVHILDRTELNAVLLGMVVIDAAHRAAPDEFAWRTETYEFVDDPIAIDLLCGSTAYRDAVESGHDFRDLLHAWDAELAAFDALRQDVLAYW